MANFKAIIFDFDGVIVESSDIKTEAFRALYQSYGSEVVEAAVAHHQAHGGISRRKKIRYIHREFLGQQLTPDELEALCHRFSELVEDAVVACSWVPGAQAYLDRNVGQRPMFVVSGTPHEELLRIVHRRGIGEYFTAVFGSPPEKPPTIRNILSTHRLRPEQVLFVGDALTDYHAAAETGLRFVGRIAPSHSNPFPEGTTVIPDLSHLSFG
ncbi:MAG: HAD family hydrolase [Hyphomicrobiales bacterium]|nr:HAD family hydrolase [Hyphomicrobiales bacterium]